MAAINEDDPEIGSLNAHLSGEPAQAIVMTPGQAGIEVKNNVLAVMPHFYGRRVDNQYEFLQKFCKLCGIQRRPAGSTEEEYRLRALPFALKGEADTWFMRLPPNSIRTWADFRSVFLDYFFPATRTNALKKEIQGATQEGDESLSMYWNRFKEMLDACPNNRMTEAEIFNNFYEGMTSESKDLVNSSSGGDFSRLRVSEAKRVINRLIDAKKAYDNPRAQSNHRASVRAATEQAEDKLGARMDQLENAILNALENGSPPLTEKCQAPLGQEEVFPNYGPQMDYQQANATGNWNSRGHWNQNGGWVPRQRDAPWREHPNFRWTESNSNPHPQPLSNAQPQERSPWPSRYIEGPHNWNNRGQGSQPNWSSRNQQSQYVPPHQRGQQGNRSPSHHFDSNEGPNRQYNQNSGPSGNFPYPQGSGPYSSFEGNFHNHGPGFNQQRAGSGQPYSRQQNRPTDDLVGDLLNSQQHLQSNIHASNDVVHKLQDAQLEQKAAMDMMVKQLSQIATSLNAMRGNDEKIPVTVKIPERETISKITLRSGKAYEEPKITGEGEDELVKQTGRTGDNYDLTKEDLLKPLPPMADPFFLDQEPDVASEERKEKEEDEVPPENLNRFPQTKPFPYRGGAKKKREDPVDFMEIFGKL
ncbi:hypothetical protein AAHA92_16428 [Salvia divinorum]|uniref:Retrotransposon gag domain-containing protein n=1 Tax=Salvia divinorum TaxID=28513 RepID=A0ABD1GVJ0_SALDI